MTKPKKLIEVAMPVKEISAESVRDKSIRHGHISTLHLWWARRPLPVCRAVVFASLVPDPLDENCPQAFKDAVKLILGKPKDGIDSYLPYKDIPYTSVPDPMEDNLRNRLLMFIGKFSDLYIANQKAGKMSPAKDQLSDWSLIKWDNRNNEEIINKARKLIWIAHNSESKKSVEVLISEFEDAYRKIKQAEKELYSLADRHIRTKEVQAKEKKLQDAIEAFLERMPKVFDPFAGGGAIPLEAARLGCLSFGNDINPVAHIIQKGSLEFPQRYGKSITYTTSEFTKLYGVDEYYKLDSQFLVLSKGEIVGVNVPNRLKYDVEFFAKKLLDDSESKIGHYYPTDKLGNKPIAYYWARVGTCSNPTCKAEVPLLGRFNLCDTNSRKVSLRPLVNGNKINFELVEELTDGGWVSRGNLKCPCCDNTTDVKTLKQQFLDGKTGHRLLVVISNGGVNGKLYRLPLESDYEALKKLPKEIQRPHEAMPVTYTQALPSCTWGLCEWGQMLTDRQALLLTTLIESLHSLNITFADKEYSNAIKIYLGILINRIAQRQTSYGIWDISRENLQAIFGRQAISMMFDYPESNPFSDFGGGAWNQLNWILLYIESESKNSFYSCCQNSASGNVSQFSEEFLSATVTDPPYYDAIAYADLSDFFYVWLKRSVGNILPDVFSTPLTPKEDECTALKHHRDGDAVKAKGHFENKLSEIFSAINKQTKQNGIVSIMFAHQSTEAWTTLCNSILSSSMNITSSWALDTEYSFTGLKKNKSFLSSSVTVSCKPRENIGVGSYSNVKRDIHSKVEEEVAILYSLGFRGADLLTACFGKAVSVFGKYINIEKADGKSVTVAELLELTREGAFNALLKGFIGDDYTKFYIGWAELNSFIETDFDDAAKFSRVGVSIDVADLFKKNIFIKNGNKQTLATGIERINAHKKLGESADSYLIDKAHRAMFLYSRPNRVELLKYISQVGSAPDNSFWRVLTSLAEVLPQGMEDQKHVLGLIANRDSLIRESKTISEQETEQLKMEFS